MLTFIALAYGLAWLVWLPLWLGGGLASPLFLPCSVTMMFTPLASAFLATRFVERTPLRTLGLGAPKPVGRFLGFLAIALVGVLAAAAVGLDLAGGVGARHPERRGRLLRRRVAAGPIASRHVVTPGRYSLVSMSTTTECGERDGWAPED